MFNNIIHKFLITASLLNNDTGETIELEKSVASVAIRKDYNLKVYPLFVINLNISEERRRYIILNNVFISLNIDRYTVEENTTSEEDLSASTPVIDKHILNVILRPFDKSKTFINPNTSDVQNDETEEAITAQLVEYSLNCIPVETLKYNSTIINECFQNANVNEILLNLISENYKGNIYLQESLNTNRYDSLLIPPLSLVQAVRYIQDEFFIYNNNVNLFFDDTQLFIYDIKEPDRTFNNELSANIIKNSDTYSADIFQTPQIDENENIRLYFKNNPMFVSNHDVYKNTIGSQTVFHSYDDNFNLVSRTYDTSDTAPDKTRYFWNTKKYSHFENSEVNKFDKYTTISCNNIDFSLFRPDTKIFFSGSDLEELNGQYALLGMTILLASNDYVSYNDSIFLTLGKI